MPELPEVETVKRGLDKLIVGKKIIAVSSDNAKSFPNSLIDVNSFAVNASFTNVRRRAKVLIIDLSSGYSFVIHLKMTGQLVFVNKNVEDRILNTEDGKSRVANSQIPIAKTSEARFAGGHPNDSLIGKLPDKSTRVEITFEDNSKLFFNDQRKFGWMRLIPTVEVKNIDFMKKVGPEPLEDSFRFSDFKIRFDRKKRSNIKATILDQSVIAGVGNIYADESLWYAKIHPERNVGSLQATELKKLYEGIRYTMKLSIEKGGSTDRNYVDAEGKKGSYLTFAKVFRREGQECERCGSEIIKLRVAGRGTHICSRCQEL